MQHSRNAVPELESRDPMRSMATDDSGAPDAALVRRLVAYQQTRDPSTLWPGLTEPERIAALHELERVTGAVLRGALSVRIDERDEHRPYALRIAGHTSGVGAMLGRWLVDGVVQARDAVANGFLSQLEHQRARSARIMRELMPAIDALTDAGVRPLALKGLHTAWTYFEEPALRRMADVDLLIEPSSVATAEAALARVGFRPVTAALRPYKRDFIGPDVRDAVFSVEHDDARSRWTLELHVSIDRAYHPGAIARLDGELLREAFTRDASERALHTRSAHALIAHARIAGTTLPVLPPSLLLLTLACHCSQELDASRLLRVVEMTRVVRAERASGRLDWDEFLAMVKRSDTARYAWPALAMVERLAPGTVDERVLRAGRRASTWAARHTVARLVPAGGSPDKRGVLRQLMWTRGSVAIAHRLFRNVWPAAAREPGDVLPGWANRMRRLRSGMLSLAAPDERPAIATRRLPAGDGRA